MKPANDNAPIRVAYDAFAAAQYRAAAGKPLAERLAAAQKLLRKCGWVAAVAACCLSAGAGASQAADPLRMMREGPSPTFVAFEPRSVQLNILSSADMARQCRSHGLRPNCGGMAAWGREFAQCIIWVDGTRLEEVLAHELRHCQEGQFHE